MRVRSDPWPPGRRARPRGAPVLRGVGRMSGDSHRAPSPTCSTTVPGVGGPLPFPLRAGGAAGHEVVGLRAVYDQAAPDPEDPDFRERVLAIAGQAGSHPAVLASAARVGRRGGGGPRLIACRSTPPGPGDMSDAGCFLYE